MKLFLLFFPLSLLYAQLPTDWIGEGATYGSQSSPKFNGWTGYATLISQKSQLYSYTTLDFTTPKTQPYVSQSNFRTGIATPLRQFGPVMVLGLATAGASTSAISIGGSFSSGALAVWQLGKSRVWTIEFGAVLLKNPAGASYTSYTIGWGRSMSNPPSVQAFTPVDPQKIVDARVKALDSLNK